MLRFYIFHQGALRILALKNCSTVVYDEWNGVIGLNLGSHFISCFGPMF